MFCFRDFAYVTVKDRLPVILTKVIDVIHKEAQALASQNEQVGYELFFGVGYSYIIALYQNFC